MGHEWPLGFPLQALLLCSIAAEVGPARTSMILMECICTHRANKTLDSYVLRHHTTFRVKTCSSSVLAIRPWPAATRSN